MGQRTATWAGIGLLILILAAFSWGAVSAEKANATMSCSPVKVEAVYVESWGIGFIASGTCDGYTVNPTNVTLSPKQLVYELDTGGYFNVTGPFYRQYASTLRIKNGTYLPGDRIPMEFHIKMRYKPLNLIFWTLRGGNSIEMNLYQPLWIRSTRKDRLAGISLYWHGTVPVKIDWTNVLPGTLVGIPFLLGLLLGSLAAVVVKNKALSKIIMNTGFLFGMVVVPLTTPTSRETQIGIFVVFELLFLAVWLSTVNRALYRTFPGRGKVLGNIALGLFAALIVFSSAWAVKTNNGFFAFGSMVLVLLVGTGLVKGISMEFEKLEAGAKSEEIRPEPIGVLLFLPYASFALLWGGVMRSSELVLFATAVFGTCLLAGLAAMKFICQKDNIHEPANLY